MRRRRRGREKDEEEQQSYDEEEQEDEEKQKREEEEAAKNFAFLQKRIHSRNMKHVAAALTGAVEAAVLSDVDKLELVALVQS